MPGGEYEPRDSREVVGTKGTGENWRKQEHTPPGSGEYEPRDSRNVTGTAQTPDGRWTRDQQQPPRAAGDFPEPEDSLEDPDTAVKRERAEREADRR